MCSDVTSSVTSNALSGSLLKAASSFKKVGAVLDVRRYSADNNNNNNNNNNNLITYIAQVFMKMIKCALH